MSKATIDDLGALHGALAKFFKYQLDTEGAEISPAMLNDPAVSQGQQHQRHQGTVPDLGKLQKGVLPFPDADPDVDSVVPFPVRA